MILEALYRWRLHSPSQDSHHPIPGRTAGIEPPIKFTVEEERDGQLAFLDVLLRRDESKVSTFAYRKATHTNQYLSFRSHHPTAHKVAVVRTLMTRAENLSSSGVERTEEEKCVTDALRGNDYPSDFIQKHTITSRRREGVEVKRPKTTLTPPYIRGLSEAIRCVLTPLGSIKVVFEPLRTFRHMLVHPAQPGGLEQGARHPTESVCGVFGLMVHQSPCFLFSYCSYCTLVL